MDQVVTKNAEKAAQHAAKAAEAAVDPLKSTLVEVGKAKWVTSKNMLIAAGVILVTGTAIVAVKRVRAMKAAQDENED